VLLMGICFSDGSQRALKLSSRAYTHSQRNSAFIHE